jgi:pimeloyl-ACP methyl ester carboxylesterase
VAQARSQSLHTLSKIGEPDVWPAITRSLLRDADDESYALCCEALAVFDARPWLAEVAAPVQVLWGEQDVVISLEAASEVAHGVQRGTFHAVADAGHLAPAEQPQTTATLLAQLPEEARA